MSASPSSLNFLADLAAKLDEAVKRSPLADVEKNLRTQFLAELANRGLVTREEYEAKLALLDKTLERLAELEAKVAALEQSRTADPR